MHFKNKVSISLFFILQFKKDLILFSLNLHVVIEIFAYLMFSSNYFSSDNCIT